MTRRAWLAAAGAAALLMGLGSYALRGEGGLLRWQSQHLPDLLHPLGLALLCASVGESRRQGMAWVAAWVVIDLLLECAQAAWPSAWQMLPGRFDPWDLLAIALGGLLAALAVGCVFERPAVCAQVWRPPRRSMALTALTALTALRAVSNR